MTSYEEHRLSGQLSYRLSRQINFFDTDNSTPFYPPPPEEAKESSHNGGGGFLVEDRRKICLSFSDLEYSIKVKRQPGGFRGFYEDVKSLSNPFAKESKQILYPMSGHFNPGRLVAIMGPSGAGKSTFLNLLSNRVRGGNQYGEVKINGQQVTTAMFKKVSGYVMQDDALLGHLTPRELLRYSARLRLPRKMSKRAKYERVEEVIACLNIEKCANTRIGIPGIKRGISGGERKRVSIALELLTNPMLMFLDEPTSGLDSTTSLFLIRHLYSLAQQGRTIVCTIHQPSSEIVQLFHDIYWLAAGRLVYSGPVKELPSYFDAMGYVCPRFVNPTDHVMSILSKDEGESLEDVEARVDKLVTEFETHNNIVPIDPLSDGEVELDTSAQDAGKVLWPIKFWILFLRSLKQRLRDPGTTFQRLIENLVVGIFAGLLFLQLGHSQTDIRNRAGVLFLQIIYCAFATGTTILYVFPQERASFLREYANGSYGVGVYYWAKSMAELPFNIFFPIVFATISYWLVGLKEEAGAFFTNLAAIIVTSNIAQSIGLIVSVGLDLEQAVTLFPVVNMPAMLVGGLFLVVNDIPYWFIWLNYLSWFFYPFMAMVINEFQDTEFHCTDSELVNNICPLTTGDQIIRSYGFEDFDIWIGFLGMGGLYVIIRLLAWFALWLLAKRRRTT